MTGGTPRGCLAAHIQTELVRALYRRNMDADGVTITSAGIVTVTYLRYGSSQYD